MNSQEPKQSSTSPAPFLSLPVELRLHIAEYAFEQSPAAGIPYAHHFKEFTVGGPWCEREHNSKASKNLSLLLVCRQFHTDFTEIAYNKTRFAIQSESRNATRIQELPDTKIRNIRKVAFIPKISEICSWGSYPFRDERLHLDELMFLWCGNTTGGRLQACSNSLYPIMRNLLHVKTIKFLLFGRNENENRQIYCRLIGTFMKDDHFYRYDAPGAPKVEATWWNWHLNEDGDIVTFTAQAPRPVLPEEVYMMLMKPKVDALMTEAERTAGL